ncbi:MAG: GGDEF domain-containing protein, partial [Gammaproteobacteria bacterium]
FSVLISANQPALMFWQGTANILIYIWCGAALLILPASRRSVGTRFTGLCLVATALLWSGYEFALLHVVFPRVDIGAGIWEAFDGRNSYLDLILEMLLAFGMILVLFEDVRHEIDTAHNELRIAHEQLLRESFTDSLTGAYNRRAFNEGTGLEEARSSFGTLVMFDMDNLKTINDQYGHKYGDALLQYFATVLRGGLRPSDKLYRLGGDEFLVVMPRAIAEVAEQRMQALIAEAAPLRLESADVEILLSTSIGTASFRSADDLETAMHDADRAMYTSKRSRKTAPRSEMPDDGALSET